MPHLRSNIEGLLKFDDEFIGKLLQMDGAEARIELLELQKEGHLYIGSDTCDNFDPMVGCRCDEKEKEYKGIVRSQEQKKLS